MKTFKLVQLFVVDYESETYETKEILLKDGLIINREDKENRWLVEAYVDGDYLDYFKKLREKYNELIIHVRITTRVNEPATCITSIIDINEIGENMNVLFLGTMVDKKTSEINELLEKMVKRGIRGEAVLERLKAVVSSR